MARTVLVVDDIEFVRKTISRIVTLAHYQVVGEAKSGKEAVEMYFNLRPDIVTMDLVMPEMSGIEATQRIVKRDHEAKIIVISALAQENIVMDAINAGARDFVQKPFTTEDLLKSFDHVLGVSHGTSQRAV